MLSEFSNGQIASVDWRARVKSLRAFAMSSKDPEDVSSVSNLRSFKSFFCFSALRSRSRRVVRSSFLKPSLM